MADPTAIVPYHDPFDEFGPVEQILMDVESPTIDFTELPSLIEPNSCSDPPISKSDGDDIGDPNDPLADPFIWDLCNTQIVDNSEAGPSNVHGESSGLVYPESYIPQSQNFGNPDQLSVWPVASVPHTCSCCLTLREIIHTNVVDSALVKTCTLRIGVCMVQATNAFSQQMDIYRIEIMKLAIHGRLGMIWHAILDKQNVSSSPLEHEYHIFDFCEVNARDVKQILVQYCEERKQGGYAMVQDPLLFFYEALCVGLEWADNHETDVFIQPSQDSAGECQVNPPAEDMSQPEIATQPEADSDTGRRTKTALAVQRERTGKLTLQDFIQHFHIPIDEAAKKMNICSTVIKKICRRDGLLRWPHRKIKSIKKKIAVKRKGLSSDDAQERACAEVDIARLNQHLAEVLAGRIQ